MSDFFLPQILDWKDVFRFLDFRLLPAVALRSVSGAVRFRLVRGAEVRNQDGWGTRTPIVGIPRYVI